LKVDGVHQGVLIERLQALLVAPTHNACFAAAVALEEAWMERSPGQAAYLADASRGGRLRRYSVSPPISGSPAHSLRNVRLSCRRAGRA
jgi:hypothetical protein